MKALGSLQQYAGSESEIDKLRERIAELEEALGARLLAPWMTPGLKRAERRLLGALLTAPFLTRDAAWAVLRTDPVVEMAHEKLVDVRLHYVRCFLKTHHIVLRNAVGEGWWVDEPDRLRLREILQCGMTLTPPTVERDSSPARSHQE